jgi:AhpD family alkylhydroperoxidase
LVVAVYAQAAREFAIVPPIAIHSPVPEILAGMWSLTREAFIVGRPGRARREMVAAGVSQTNRCPYCVEVHSAMLHATRDHDLARKLSSDAGAEEAAQAEPLIRWALSTRDPQAPALAHPPFPPQRPRKFSAPQRPSTSSIAWSASSSKSPRCPHRCGHRY